MYTTYSLKPGFQNLLRPCVRLLASAFVKPNQITIAALGVSCVSGMLLLLYGQPMLFILAPALLLRMALNAIDGMLAREHGMATRSGMVLNELGDIASDAALYLPLAMLPHMPAQAAVFAFVLLATWVEMAGVVAALATGRRSCAGPMGKSDRALAVGVLAVALGSGVVPSLWGAPCFWLFNVLMMITFGKRVHDALRTH